MSGHKFTPARRSHPLDVIVHGFVLDLGRRIGQLVQGMQELQFLPDIRRLACARAAGIEHQVHEQGIDPGGITPDRQQALQHGP